ncbi:hypothetical protein CM49_05186 [Paenibacillus sp. P1XP2]|nr:hypothetical protein CM49_05186 [Paenibacillus sp. P1XP2]
MSGITKAAVLTMLAAFLLGGCTTKGSGTGTPPAVAAKPPAVQEGSKQAPDTASNKDILPDSDAVPVALNGKTYLFPNRVPNNKEFVHAAATSKGIVWTTAPVMKDSESELGKIPLEPFAIYLHVSSETSVSFQNSKLAYKLPLQDGDANWYFPSGLYGGVKDHVIINAYRRKPGMAQRSTRSCWIWIWPREKQKRSESIMTRAAICSRQASMTGPVMSLPFRLSQTMPIIRMERKYIIQPREKAKR